MKIGRNEPCPCGSGKKYKKCCLNKKDPGSDQDKTQITWEEAAMEHEMLQMGVTLPFEEIASKKNRIERLEKIIAGCPDFYPSILDHGMQLMTKGKLQETRKDLDKGLKIMRDRNVESEEIKDTINSVCQNLETYFCYREAIDYYEMILDLDVDDASISAAHSDIANCCYYINDLDRALENAKKAVLITPDSSNRLSDLGWIRLTRGELSSAKELLERAVKKDPEDRTAQGNLKACNPMMDNDLNDWISFLLNSYDYDAVKRMEEEEDYEGVDRERRSYNLSLMKAFRHELAGDDFKTYLERYDMFFTLSYALKMFEDVVFDYNLLYSDITEIESSMDRFLARLIIKTGDINDEIFDGSLNAILEFYRFLESRGLTTGFEDIEEEVDDLREEFREKMHAYNLARRTGDQNIKMRARVKLFGELYWSLL